MIRALFFACVLLLAGPAHAQRDSTAERRPITVSVDLDFTMPELVRLALDSLEHGRCLLGLQRGDTLYVFDQVVPPGQTVRTTGTVDLPWWNCPRSTVALWHHHPLRFPGDTARERCAMSEAFDLPLMVRAVRARNLWMAAVTNGRRTCWWGVLPDGSFELLGVLMSPPPL